MLMLTMLLTFFGAMLAIAAVVTVLTIIVLQIYKKKVGINLDSKQLELRKNVLVDYRTCSAIYLKIFTGRQIGYSLEFVFENDQRWTYHLTGNHKSAANADKAKITRMIQEMPAIRDTLFGVESVEKVLGHSYIQIGKEEAQRFLYAPRTELNDIYTTL